MLGMDFLRALLEQPRFESNKRQWDLVLYTLLLSSSSVLVFATRVNLAKNHSARC